LRSSAAEFEQVDRVLEQAEQALASHRWHVRKPALEALRSAKFQRRLRGYGRDQVHRTVEERIRRLS
jgi:hypothetical protein